MTEQQALAKTEEPGAENNLALLKELEGFTGYEEISPSALIVPRVKIIQPTSKEGTPGTLVIACMRIISRTSPISTP